ncbi:transporter [Rhizobium sp. 1399]|jgi:hypothetical protein|uniref:transporter n=1 Tax=Rhizobium sp. 1399 TaxID=2817758 RepID=UPI0028600FB2|nr:transporter [Rhizobium sp. 1399]MDR6669555.1 hypothetical protein [Rhizobium sp. 1399]
MDVQIPIRFLIILAADGDNSEVRIARLAPAYYLFRDAPAEIVLATPSGGFPDLTSELRQSVHKEPTVGRFLTDRAARDDLADTLRLDQIVTEDFDAAFCIGLSGPLWSAEGVAATIRAFLTSGKPVAVIPGRRLDITPEGAAAGLLILGDCEASPLLSAHALLKVVLEGRKTVTSAG